MRLRQFQIDAFLNQPFKGKVMECAGTLPDSFA